MNSKFESELSVDTSCLCFLLKLYPAAANISLYVLAKDYRAPDFLIRLILNANKSIEPQSLCDLNYMARKEAILLAFRALTSDGEPTIWIRLRHESIDLLMHTISYL
jgi:hypothetical protein